MLKADERMQESFCLLDVREAEINIGIIGAGPGLGSLLEIVEDESYRDFLPEMAVSAACEADPAVQRYGLLTRRSIPVYDNAEAMLKAHPKINTVIELVGKRYRLGPLRSSLPDHVSLIDHNAAVFLCGLHATLRCGNAVRGDLNRQKALLSSLLDEMEEDVLLLDRKGNVVDANEKVAACFKSDKKGIRHKAFRELLSCIDGDSLCPMHQDKCPFDVVLQTAKKAEALRTVIDEDGRLKYFREYAYPVFNTVGSLENVLLLRRDITSRKEKEQHERHAEKLAVIGEMSALLAHEIRNPLFAIGGFTNSLLKSDNLEDKQREKLDIIAEETRRLDRMLTGVLNFARPSGEAGNSEADADKVVHDTMELMRIGCEKKGLRFSTHSGDSLPMIQGDPEVVKQCLVNLVKNSMEAMPDGGTISIQTGIENDMVFIRVDDEGIGMNKKELENALSPFFTTKKDGYGLGLSMIKKIVEERGGRIELKSKKGQGTTATMSFRPALAKDDDDAMILTGPDQDQSTRQAV
jgi:signal transduction histidine kinase